MTTALEGVSGQQHAPAALYPRKRTDTHFTGGWVGPRAVWTGGKSRPHRDSIPDLAALSSVAIQTKLAGPQFIYIYIYVYVYVYVNMYIYIYIYIYIE